MMQMEQERRAQGGAGNGQDEDPFARMMQQMMAMGGQGDPNNPNAGAQDMPAMLQSLMGGAQQGNGQQGNAQPAPASSVYLWRIVHGVFAFTLAFYVCLTSTFNGTQTSRYQVSTIDEAGNRLGPRLFIIFTSAELVLQSTRYFMEKGQLQGGGPLATIANSGFIPEPYANYIRITGRYIGIAKTIFSDVMVIIFVMGCIAWWNGQGIATIA
jgi:hypothetical protein